MQKYIYKAMKPDGKVIRGKLIANNSDELKNMVQKNGLYLMSFAEDIASVKTIKRMDSKSLITLCNQLASMLKAGLSISNSLEMLYTRIENKTSKKALGVMYESVKKGMSLSDAISEMGNTFPPMMLSMVKAGELSGELDQTLKKLGAHFESDNKLNKKIKGAMSYPLTLLAVAGLVVIVMVAFVLPKMAGSMGDELPPLTKGLLDLADIIKKPVTIAIIVVFVVLMIFLVPVIKRQPKVKMSMDKFKLKIPKIGNMIKMIYTSRFAKGLATLYDNGIELITAMEMCRSLVGNVYVAERMGDAVERIKKGEPISTAMSSINCFDPLLISMIYVGEESGVLGEVLGQTAAYFDEESDYSIQKIVGMINPIMLLFMAGVIGVVIMAVMGPMFSMYQM